MSALMQLKNKVEAQKSATVAQSVSSSQFAGSDEWAQRKAEAMREMIQDVASGYEYAPTRPYNSK